MSDPIIPEPGSLTAPEAKTLIEAAEKVVRVAADYLNAFEKKPLRDAIAELATVLRHVTPEDIRAKIEQHAYQ